VAPAKVVQPVRLNRPVVRGPEEAMGLLGVRQCLAMVALAFQHEADVDVRAGEPGLIAELPIHP
jgi:hypothetical protein